MKTTKIELKIDGIKVKMDIELLENIAWFIPEYKANTKVFKKLATLDNYVVKKHIANKKYISKKTIKKLLKEKNDEIISKLLTNKDAAKKLSNKQLEKIIKRGDPKHYKDIALCSNSFVKCNINKIIKFLSKSKDPIIRAYVVMLVSNDIPIDIAKKLTKDKDYYVANKAKEYIVDNADQKFIEYQ